MALKKGITEGGLPLEYHRIKYITIDVHERILVSVNSYLNDAAREYEKVCDSGNGEDYPHFAVNIFAFPYEDDMTITKAYELLKTLPEFEGSEDV
jgi:hypothetical protein